MKKVYIIIIILIFLIILIVGIPLLINQLYLCNNGYITLWEAKDVLSYYGAVLSFIGTVVLGYFSILVAKQSKDISDKLMTKEMIESAPYANIKPEISINREELSDCSIGFENLHSFSSTNVMFIEKNTLTEEEVRKRHFVEYTLRFSFENTSKSKIKAAYILTDSLTLYKNSLIVSKFIHHSNYSKAKVLINCENRNDFSFFIKLYAFDHSIVDNILNEGSEISLAFEVEYISITNTKKVLFHQMWLKKENDIYLALATRNTELEGETCNE